ncbi:HNH endonuclease signature motif containing protein [Microbacterium phyllosphaerae]|uniref:HNH endonuclease signature motif containing protein n=1 Tax=Microbacterium phyllosphaerae TaxID=124798 RepID=UPI000EA36F00|nr:HNH endonuclease signature motif containing protein [Microbacterium phyllosphaerae]
MTALMDATVEQLGALGAVTEMLVEVDRTIGSLLAARDGLLALGSRIAVEAAGQVEEATADGVDLATRAVAAEFGAALRVSDRTVQRRMLDAEVIVSRFPRVWRAQGAGLISAAHARVIVDAGRHLEDPAARDAYAARLVAFAQTESPNRVGRMARRVADRFQPRSIDARHADARKQRGVWVKNRADGMAELSIFGPAALVHGAFERVDAMAKAALADSSNGSGSRSSRDASSRDERTRGQARSDVALDLLLTSAPAGHDTEGMLGAIRATVSITVPVMSLIGASTVPAELDGCIPIDIRTAQLLAGTAAGWDRVLTHPITGALLAVDRYRPSAAVRRHLTARDQRCRFPACGYSARDCDIDHTRDHATGGTTDADNLGDLCRRHHSLKHRTPWHVEHLGHGVFAWTSPTGQTYLDKPPVQNTTIVTEDDTPPPF